MYLVDSSKKGLHDYILNEDNHPEMVSFLKKQVTYVLAWRVQNFLVRAMRFCCKLGPVA